MIDRDYLLRQAELCTRLSRLAWNPIVADSLRQMAAEFRQRAEDVDAVVPAYMVRRMGRSGRSDQERE